MEILRLCWKRSNIMTLPEAPLNLLPSPRRTKAEGETRSSIEIFNYFYLSLSTLYTCRTIRFVNRHLCLHSPVGFLPFCHDFTYTVYFKGHRVHSKKRLEKGQSSKYQKQGCSKFVTWVWKPVHRRPRPKNWRFKIILNVKFIFNAIISNEILKYCILISLLSHMKVTD